MADVDGAGVARADVIIEAIFEDVDAKRDLFAAIEPRMKADAVMATNTSAIPLADISSVLKEPERLIGIHFFNPVPIMKLVEVVSTVATADDVAETTRALCARVDKVAVSCGDRAGFIVNRLLVPYLLDAVRAFEQPLVLIAGGRSKGNPIDDLAEAVAERVSAAVLIGETADELDPEWFIDAQTVGVTAGASTPDRHMAAVVDAIEQLALPISPDSICSRALTYPDTSAPLKP